MEEAINLRSVCFIPHKFPLYNSHKTPKPSSKISPIFLSKKLLIPPRPPISPPKPPTDPSSPFREKLLFLDSVGIDSLPLAKYHPPIISTSLADLRSTVDFLLSLNFSSADLRRICGMCPEILTAAGPFAFNSVLNFLLHEVGVHGGDLRHVISRRPRLLVSDVKDRLRPTLYFLKMIGVEEIGRYTHLLSCSVEEKFLPRIEFFERVGFSVQDSRFVVRRFPQILCYSIKGNLEPKMEFLTGVMGRGIGDVKRFPRYFSFSLEGRIKRRFRVCEENAVFFELGALLKPSDEEFWRRLEVCVSSSAPVRNSALWKVGLSDDYL